MKGPGCNRSWRWAEIFGPALLHRAQSWNGISEVPAGLQSVEPVRRMADFQGHVCLHAQRPPWPRVVFDASTARPEPPSRSESPPAMFHMEKFPLFVPPFS